MFANFITIIAALFMFSSYTPGKNWSFSLVDIFPLIFLLVLYALLLRYKYRSLGAGQDDNVHGSGSKTEFQRTASFAMAASLAFFFIAIFLLRLKEIIIIFSFFPEASFIHEILGLGFYFLFLFINWKTSFFYYERFFNPSIDEQTYIRSQCMFNLPILVPWALFSALFFLSDLLFKIAGINLSDTYLEYVEFGLFFVLVALFLPVIIKKIWDCRPLPDSELRRELMGFCKDNGLRFNNMLLWNLYGGNLLTAGIMGLVERFRYILITPALLTNLTLHELKSVLAHEIGHNKNRHILFYFLLIVGFILLTFIYPETLLLLLVHTSVLHITQFFEIGTGGGDFYNFLLTFPLLIAFIIYYRYFFGFMSRAFEREADIHSLQTMGNGAGLISSLEKIAFWGGNREEPNWHHYSIKERVDFIAECSANPALITGHKRKVRLIKRFYLIFLVVATVMIFYIKNVGLEQNLKFNLHEKIFTEEVGQGRGSFELYFGMANLYFEEKRYTGKIHERGD